MKRLLITIRRVVASGISNFGRNAWLSVAATAVMFVALSIVLSGIVLNAMARGVIKEVSKQYRVSIYLKDGVKEEERNNLKRVIEKNPIVASVQYLTSEDARKTFTERSSDKQSLLQALALVGGEALPSSLEVSVTKLEKIQEIKTIAQQKDYENIVEGTSIGKTDSIKTIDRTVGVQKIIVRVSIVAAAIFSGISILIIFNTIRMAIFNRGDEIRIMKLIGATPNYIRGPFVVESCLYGIIAAILANAALYGVLYSLGTDIANKAEFKEAFDFFVQPSIEFTMLFGACLVGMLVGIISSTLAMEKYLKLKHW